MHPIERKLRIASTPFLTECKMLVLTDKKLNETEFSKDVKVIKLNSCAELKNYSGSADVVALCGSRAMAITAEKMDFPSMKLVQLTSAGFDGVPLAEYAKRGIPVCNAGSVYSAPMAETIVFGMLQFAKRYRKNPNNRRFKLLRKYSLITELADKKVLIMGAGNIGTAVADRLKGFSMHIDGYDIFDVKKPQYEKMLHTRDELINNIGNYDYIVCTLPDNDETRGFFDKEIFGAMNKNAVIVNVGRRAVFNENDFYSALKNKVIGGAVLDMFEKIPNPITNKFRRLSNTVILPGVAAISQELNVRLRDLMTNNVKAAIEGQPLSFVVNSVE